MSPYDSGFRFGFLSGRAHEWIQRDHEAELRRPINLAAMNPPSLLAPTRCKVLRPFYVAGKPLEVGAIVELPRHDALSLAAIRKVEIIA